MGEPVLLEQKSWPLSPLSCWEIIIRGFPVGKGEEALPSLPVSARPVFSTLGLLVCFLFPQVTEGKLAPFLGKVIKFATAHVYSCSLCSQKGFICEICNNGEILYPFEDISTSRYRALGSMRMYVRVMSAFAWPEQDSSELSIVSHSHWKSDFPLFLYRGFSRCFLFSSSPHSLAL